MVHFSVVIPVYNAAATLAELVARTEEVLATTQKKYEIILVDDGSKDNSWLLIQSLKKRYPDRVKGVQLLKNFGQHNATFCGIVQAVGQLLITIDDDLEYAPEDILLLLKTHEVTKKDLIYGLPHKTNYSLIRKTLTNAFRLVQRTESKQSGKGSSFRLMSQALHQNIRQNVHAFVFIDEICLWHTNQIGYVSVSHQTSKKGKSGYSVAQLLGLSFNLIFFSSNRPLHLMRSVGFTASLFSFLIGLKFIYSRITNDVPLGYTSLIVAILFSTGLILFCLGIVGEYLNRVYQAQNKVPLYSIREII